jgi:hypothetical protein
MTNPTQNGSYTTVSKTDQFMLMVQTGLILYYTKNAPSIPDNVPAQKAASQFLRWALRPDNYEPSECPSWLADSD